MENDSKYFFARILFFSDSILNCVPCNKQFRSQQALEQHIQVGHRCELCNKSFQSIHSKRQHTRSAKNHSMENHRPVVKAAPPQMPVQDCQEGNDQPPELGIGTNGDNLNLTYTGVPRAAVTPVFKIACRLRFMKPDVNMLLRRIDTQLDTMVISALIEAALRLLPPDNSPNGRAEAEERMRQKRERALIQETSFIDRMRDLGYQFRTEREQKELRLSPTPDIRFLEPVSVNGHSCYWIEYKNYFGFKANPFITSKNKKQFRKYVSGLGPGAVVYKLGYEIEHIAMIGVETFREAEFLNNLEQESRLRK
ncbi:Zinc finger, C2H2 [Penicillium roqueforti FM164]|uniref:CDAN1-interacting nuclease 1 n=1 Tax=Penicillium roqueforti (strain FM164) TaxID=1365484 RepID=W6QND4_PENRF|nr:Zinc finger, C2H2 [Penicillium roqueforti FM164]